MKDFAYGQLMNKPSLLTACKDEIINYIYNPKALSTDLYDLKIVKEETLDKPAIFEVEDDLNLFKQDDVKEKVEPQIVQQVQKESPKEDDDKHFEPTSKSSGLESFLWRSVNSSLYKSETQPQTVQTV